MKFVNVLTLGCVAITLSGCGGDWGPEKDGDGFGDDQAVVSDVAIQILHQSTALESGLEHTKQIRFFGQQVDYEDELINYTSDDAAIVDFDQNQVVLLDMGTRSIVGYQVELVAAYKEENIVTLDVSYTTPGNGCGDSSTDYTPYLFARVETTAEIVVEESAIETNCN